MKKFSPPQMKEVSFPTPHTRSAVRLISPSKPEITAEAHTLHPLSSQESLSQ
jgi:hypothetical protein